MEKGFENFDPIFGQVKAEWENPSSDLPSLLPFLFHVHGLDSKHLRIRVTDFLSYTWESIKSMQQLEDLRDETGIGGSWSEFINYLMDSIKSDNVKLVLGGSVRPECGAKFAKLLAHKTEGIPPITIYLERLVNSCASEAISNLSWEIFKAFKSRQELLVKEQQRSYELTEKLYAEGEKLERVQDKLGLALSSKKQKLSKLADSDMRPPIPTTLIDLDTMSVSDITNSLGKPPTQCSPSMKASPLVPAYRRIKVRGMVMDDADDGDGM